MRSQRPKLEFETIASIAAMVIGACALYVAWDQAQVMRAQQHASVLPLLYPDFTIDETEENLILMLTVSNEGVGPALVESAFLTVDGERKDTQVELMKELFGGARPTGSARVYGTSLESSVVGAGDRQEVFRVAWERSEANEAAFAELAGRYVNGDGPQVSLTLCYCSVFDRCFVSDGVHRPDEAESCPEATGFFAAILGGRAPG